MDDAIAFESAFISSVADQAAGASLIWPGADTASPSPDDALTAWWAEEAPGGHGPRLPNPWDRRAAIAGMEQRCWGIVQRLGDSLGEAMCRATDTNHDAAYWRVLLEPWLLHVVSAIVDRRLFLLAAQSAAPEAALASTGATLGPPATMASAVTALCFEQGTVDLLALLAPELGLQTVHEPALTQGRPRPDVPSAARLSSALRSPIAASRLATRMAGTAWVTARLRRQPTARVAVVGYSGFAAREVHRLASAVPGVRMAQITPPLVLDVAVDRERRRRVGERLAVSDTPDPVERLARAILPDILPRSVVEAHALLHETSAAAFGQAMPTLACNYAADDVQNEFLGRSVEAGMPVWCAQHGGFYLQARVNAQERLERRPGSEFWSWGGRGKGVVPTPTPRLERLRNRHRGGRMIALIEDPPIPGPYVLRFSSLPLGDQAYRAAEVLPALVASVSQATRQLMRLKRFPGFGDRPRSPTLAALPAGGPAGALDATDWMRRARIVVIPYPDTPFIESLVLGTPTIGVWDPALWEMRDDLTDVLVELRASKVVFDDPASAAAHLDAVADEPDVWWRTQETQAARESAVRRLGEPGDWLSAWTAGLRRLSAASPVRPGEDL